MWAVFSIYLCGVVFSTAAGEHEDGVTVSAPRIIGGHETVIEQYPFMVKTEYNWWWIFWSFYCGGALLSETTVLSAASCYGSDKASWWRVRVGTSGVNGGTLHSVAQIITHPRRARGNDIALLRLGTPVALSERVKIARIPGKNFNLPDNTVLTALGWGRTTVSGGIPSYLQHVDVQLINQTLCAERYDYLRTQPGYQNLPEIGLSMLCAGDLDKGGKDACLYDEGGPLVYDKDIVVGIISWRYRCGNAYYPGVYTRVSYFADWIVQYG